MGVATLPMIPFCSDVDRWGSYVRLVFCKRDQVLEDVGARLRQGADGHLARHAS